MCDVEALDLDQLLADPLVRLVMSSDAVEESDIRRLAERVTRSRPLQRELRFCDQKASL